MEHPLEMIYEYVEQAYLRQQVGDVLLRCLEKEDIEPMQKMVEELILSGPEPLSVLRQFISETNVHRSHIEDQLHQLLVALQAEWEKHGIAAVQFPNIILYSWLPAEVCLEMLDQEGIAEEQAQIIYKTTIQKNRKQMTDLADQLRMIKEIEVYLQDWLWGMAYETFHREHPKEYPHSRQQKRGGKPGL